MAPAGSTVLLLGNEAIARGAIEAGVGFAAAYPGTPSTEIIESLARVARDLGIHVEWSTNEKVAFEAAYGAAISGVRSLVALKHVGLNVAADPLMSSAYTGAEAGFVIVTADDPNMWSSQNEQDNRFYGLHAFIPIFESYCPAEVKNLTKYAFDFSEKMKHPVILRTTTRLSHARGPVTFNEIPKIKIKGKFSKNPSRWTLIPAHARKLRSHLLEKWNAIKEAVNEVPFNWLESHDSNLLIIASGIAYGYVKDSLKMLHLNEKIDVLKISTPVPLPEKLTLKALKSANKVLVVEELEPIVELEVKKLAFENKLEIEIYGKNLIPQIGELTIDRVAEGIAKIAGVSLTPLTEPKIEIEIPSRPPTFCPGCPHRASFMELKKALAQLKIKDAIFCGDIGCYSLGVFQPFEAQDIIIEMGGSIGVANGLTHTTNQIPIAIMGDSTFYHACIPGLINAIYNNSPMLVLVLDNRITAMTGHQPHPGTGLTASGEKAVKILPEDIAKGLGVEYVEIADPYEVNETINKIKRALKYVRDERKVAFIVMRRACSLLMGMIARRKGIESPKYKVNEEKCKACGICYDQFGCPAITPTANGKAEIIGQLCIGCSVCAQLCPFNAIEIAKKASKKWEDLSREVR